MKNFRLITLPLVLLLCSIFNEGMAQTADLALVNHGKVERYSVPGSDPENVERVTNPLTTHFSVMPRIAVAEGNVVVCIYNPNRIRINVSLHNDEGYALHQDKTASLYYGRLLNISELGAGEYELALNVDSISARYVIKIGSQARTIKVKQVAEYNTGK